MRFKLGPMGRRATVPVELKVDVVASDKLRQFVEKKETNKFIYLGSIKEPITMEARSRSLCLTEKLTIFRADSNSTLNKRTEINKKCQHTNKFKLSNFYLISLTYSFCFLCVICKPVSSIFAANKVTSFKDTLFSASSGFPCKQKRWLK